MKNQIQAVQLGDGKWQIRRRISYLGLFHTWELLHTQVHVLFRSKRYAWGNTHVYLSRWVTIGPAIFDSERDARDLITDVNVKRIQKEQSQKIINIVEL